MSQQEERIRFLYQCWYEGQATAEETEELFTLLRGQDIGELLGAAMKDVWDNEVGRLPELNKTGLTTQRIDQMANDIFATNGRVYHASASFTHRVHFLRTAWFRYAAAIILVFGVAAYFWNANKKDAQPVVSGNKPLQTDVSPGGNKALLTLADGTAIALDDATNGTIAKQGNVEVVKLANGQITYRPKGITQGEMLINTMSTPPGGQYQLVLPDGTKVWLNAASSITYPTVFTAPKRSVKVSGEVYFEVTKNKQKPFVVDVDGRSSLEVLGTSFNVNSYTNESSMNTTLFEGSVKVTAARVAQSAILKPGEQASINNTAGIVVKSDVDLSQVLAWKNGIFDFTGADLKAVMRQLERWYDIRVLYKGNISNMTFDGRMYRNVNLSNVLNFLKEAGLKFRMEGRNLIVL